MIKAEVVVKKYHNGEATTYWNNYKEISSEELLAAKSWQHLVSSVLDNMLFETKKSMNLPLENTPERFVNEKLLLQHLPIFFGKKKTAEELEKMVDFFEEELILKRAEEIKQARNKRHDSI